MACAGVATPDHTIRTKNYPLIVPPPEAGGLDDFAAAVRHAVERFVADYHAYFARHNVGRRRSASSIRCRASILVPGLGLFGLGRSAKDAAIAADLAESWVETMTDAEAVGRFEVAARGRTVRDGILVARAGQARQRDREAARRPGRGGHRRRRHDRAATARALQRRRRRDRAARPRRQRPRERREKARRRAASPATSPTPEAVRAAFDRVAERFGGVDIVVSNAGAAWQGRIGEVSDAVLRQSFELNFFAHQSVAQSAVRVMLAQGTGGCLLFNVSKQALNPGADFGPYGLPKAATLALDAAIRARLRRRGHPRQRGQCRPHPRRPVDAGDDRRARQGARRQRSATTWAAICFGREVTAEDVAQAFLHLALALKTTGDVATVDGGNIAAALR